MADIDAIKLLATTVAAGTPVLYATLGEILTERSGVLNLGLEGMMLVGGLAGFAATASTGNLVIGLLAAMAAGATAALLHAFFSITIGVNQVVSGLALTLAGTGIASYFGRSLVGQPAVDSFKPIELPILSDIPALGQILFRQDLMVYLSFLLVPILFFFIYRTRPGLRLRAVGESPATADSQGIRVTLTRYVYTMAGGALVGCGGAYVSLAYSPSWQENITAGRGWIAVGLVIFAMWNPWRALLGAYLFGGMEAFQFSLQVAGVPVSSYFLRMTPYLLTIIALAFSQWWARKHRSGNVAPAALGQLYLRRDRN
ncbi:MAG: ABC transporter permease [Chloroflexi bacterium]|uniref:ABC transporter permease n=1 Tax=Candidatus Chlorohelix allophototropha TaxID=3003348 RepID=A0A8T7M7X9_9CHLR|nr:ABC transporter permease [Chloroflexota bacterium]WJW68176.1 ABC transporter permease [Chloroflexota bacterium L227-S17]